MKTMKTAMLAGLILTPAIAMAGAKKEAITDVADSVIEQQRAALAVNTEGKGFGPQSPRDIDVAAGTNSNKFSTAPDRSEMNLCNIHFHIGAEHKGGEFTTYAGNGDGQGHGTGYLFDGELKKKQLKPVKADICGGLVPGDTIEVHFVHTTAQIEPGPTLGACLQENIMNPQLRVEAQVIVLANDSSAADFVEMAQISQQNGYFQAANIPTDTGTPVEYEGSTTGPSYNEKGSPLQVSWSVRPEVAVVDINSVGKWCNDNRFDEDHAHGVRNLVLNPQLLSAIK
ncbi:MAG: hypothetical protein CSH36_09275 [Thalassolituus sp.]|uniref:delta-class carbonic anhydrase n=1 Tax=uncultured Thalassolituus sp. TaxID=285273 RepID=UPI0026072C49|nr:delta-class carbonic anhydrase [uncultured Thalassolituus sp.]TNC91511.1 MAG: hypothetical protein CSH36_09275 [Thalassolituus sp.]